jgi:hypothetical protein
LPPPHAGAYRFALLIGACALLSGCPPLPIPSTYYVPASENMVAEPQSSCAGGPAEVARFDADGVRTFVSFDGTTINLSFDGLPKSAIEVDSTQIHVDIGDQTLPLANIWFWESSNRPHKHTPFPNGQIYMTGPLALHASSPVRDPEKLVLYIPPVKIDGMMTLPHTVEFHRVQKVLWRYLIINC